MIGLSPGTIVSIQGPYTKLDGHDLEQDSPSIGTEGRNPSERDFP